MRKQILAMLIAIGMTCAFAPMVGAAPDATITVTLTPGGTAAVVVYLTAAPTEHAVWTGNGATLGETEFTTGGAYTVNNTGNVQADITVAAHNAGGWDLVDATPAHNEVCLQFNLTAPTDPWVSIMDAAPANFVLGLPQPLGTDTQAFDLKVIMPPSSSTDADQVITITFTATAAD